MPSSFLASGLAADIYGIMAEEKTFGWRPRGSNVGGGRKFNLVPQPFEKKAPSTAKHSIRWPSGVLQCRLSAILILRPHSAGVPGPREKLRTARDLTSTLDIAPDLWAYSGKYAM